MQENLKSNGNVSVNSSGSNMGFCFVLSWGKGAHDTQKSATNYLTYSKNPYYFPPECNGCCDRDLKMSSQQGTVVYVVFNNPCCSIGLSACLKKKAQFAL